jgi:hypothetical protein
VRAPADVKDAHRAAIRAIKQRYTPSSVPRVELAPTVAGDL